MFNIKYKYLLSFSLCMMAAINFAIHASENNTATQITQNLNCSNNLSDAQFKAIKSQYTDVKTDKKPTQIMSIDLNGDEFCDFLVEYQEKYPVCGTGSAEACERMAQGQWTDFYLATSAGEYAEKAISAERGRWTDGGLYASYKLKGDATPFIVWDLRGDGRKSQYEDSYMTFKWTEVVDYLDAEVRHDYSVEKEMAQKILTFHNKEIMRSK